MSNYDIGAAIVGAGFIGPVHLEALRRLGVRITGILGCNERESQSAQEMFGLPKAYKDFDEVLSDADVQSIHLAVPNVLHYEFSSKALNAGKHVMCEKPLAMNSKETSELVALAGSKSLAAGVCYNVRYYPLNLQARQMVQDGDVGDLFHINGSYLQDWLFHDTDYNWRVLADQGGALRAVADIGTHWMDLIYSITGLEIDAVFADLKTIHKIRKRPNGEVETFTGKPQSEIMTEEIPISTEDYGCIMFRFANGASGSLYVSQVAAGRKNCIRYEIAGSKCALGWNSESPNEMWIGNRDSANQNLIRNPTLMADTPRQFTNYPAGHNEGFPDTFKQCFRSFYDYIEKSDFNAAPLFPTFKAGHREVVLCEAILKSNQEEKWITL
jgi:predicted dehydrogenase